MVVSYIDFVLFLNCCVCVVCGCWEEYGKEKKNMTIACEGNTIFRNVQTICCLMLFIWDLRCFVVYLGFQNE